MFDGIIDINHNNEIDLSAAKAAGIVAIIHKATEGATFQDPLYATRRAGAQQLGLRWGAYHFGTAADVGQQYQNFIATAQPEAGDLVALDYELNDGNQMSQQQAEEFVTQFEQQYGYLPLIYGSNLLTAVSSTSPLSRCALWIAEYVSAAQPTMPPAFNSYTLWQFTDGTSPTPLQTAGVTLDRDRYDGTQEALLAAWPFHR
ncbi:MAG TPA: glycoside hydrolase family 25 protein [Thermoanaerobaculia bacterium]|nr:glycoside hydrolase family 25 protein [Thermoanaerobaculia bacterium]